MVKCLPAMRETWVQSLGQEDPLEKDMTTHSSTLAWKIPWAEKPGRLQSMGLQRVGHNWVTSLSFTLDICPGVWLPDHCCCCCLVAKLCPTVVIPWTVAHQAPLSMGFSRQEYWSGLPCPSRGDLPDPGMEPVSSALPGGFFTAKPPGKPLLDHMVVLSLVFWETLILLSIVVAPVYIPTMSWYLRLDLISIIPLRERWKLVAATWMFMRFPSRLEIAQALRTPTQCCLCVKSGQCVQNASGPGLLASFWLITQMKFV